MKKTILLVLALAAGFLTMGGAARRNNEKRGGVIAIRHFFAAAILAGLAVLLTACGASLPVQYYNYKSGESNFYAAQSVCQGKAQAAAPSFQVYNSGQNCQPDYACEASNAGRLIPVNCKQICKPIISNNAGERSSIIRSVYEQCITEAGWLPCSQGGQGRPECACLYSGANGKPTCQ